MKLLDQVRETIRFKHYSLSTEETYIGWIRQFILYHNKRHPDQIGFPQAQRTSAFALDANVSLDSWRDRFSCHLNFLYAQQKAPAWVET